MRRFGAESFTRGDGVSWSVVAKVLKRARAVGGMASPPCKFYSTARVRGESRAPPMIEQTRDSVSESHDAHALSHRDGGLRLD